MFQRVLTILIFVVDSLLDLIRASLFWTCIASTRSQRSIDTDIFFLSVCVCIINITSNQQVFCNNIFRPLQCLLGGLIKALLNIYILDYHRPHLASDSFRRIWDRNHSLPEVRAMHSSSARFLQQFLPQSKRWLLSSLCENSGSRIWNPSYWLVSGLGLR